ncbi:MAG: response regulator transcription factor [Burkholderiales bacterium]|nr:response regulator transcription factor [Burkholderiales bacterium]
MIRQGLAAMLEGETDMAWVGEAGDGAEAVRAAPALAPDVVLMDLGMPKMDGFEAMTHLRPLLPRTRFVVITGGLDPSEVRRAVSAGADAFVVKNASKAELVEAIRATGRGERLLAPDLGAVPATAGSDGNTLGSDLTRRERELLTLMARGMSNQGISSLLSIAMPTVKFHVTNILAKLHTENRTAAVLVALRNHIVTLE